MELKVNVEAGWNACDGRAHELMTHTCSDGEEFSRAARLWTSGYDFYTLSRSIVFHDYSQPGTVVSFPTDRQAEAQTNQRVFELLGMPVPLDSHGHRRDSVPTTQSDGSSRSGSVCRTSNKTAISSGAHNKRSWEIIGE